MSDVAAVAAAVIALAALVVSILALRWARVSAQAGKDSAAAAAESLRWSKLSAEAAQAAAGTAADAEAARREEAAEAAVQWTVKRGRPGEVQIVNLGPQPAFEVAMRLSPLSPVGNAISLETQPEQLPGTSRTVNVRGHDEQPSPWVEVWWKVDPADAGYRKRKLAMPAKLPPARVTRARFDR